MQSQPDSSLQLLKLLFTPNQIGDLDLINLNPSQQEHWLQLIKDHRLGPLLYWRLSRERPNLQIPEEIAVWIKHSYRQSTLRHLALQRELIRLQRMLSASSFPFIALKGAFLAFHSYPNPGLRPLRDIDILVRPQDAMKVFQLLVDAGYQQHLVSASAESIQGIRKHLPPLSSPDLKISIEIHTRLTDPGSTQYDAVEDILSENAFNEAYYRSLSSIDIRYLSPTRLLLHLIVHAVYDHQFNNGPLFISDVYYLLEKESIDWSLFWKWVKQGGWERGTVLALSLIGSYHPDLKFEWPEYPYANPSNEIVEQAAKLTLAEFKYRGRTKIFSILFASMANMTKILSEKFFPSKKVLNSFYSGASTPWLGWIYYPYRWLRLLLYSAPKYLLSTLSLKGKHDINSAIQIVRWLEHRP